MTFVEHNNRKIANKFAEYVTGEPLRKYVARKVKQYVGDNPTVFDGAVGSGQLEQFIKPEKLFGCEIQEESCKACLKNFPTAEIANRSFFDYDNNILADCAVMNPPFSIAFKSLSDAEKQNIQNDFPWKKSGKVDDIFMLKAMKFSKRFGFFIMFPGIGYRKTEQKMRELVGNQLVELNVIQNAFEDTGISILFIVMDKQKTSDTCQRELYDCKTDKRLVSDEWQINSENWEQIQVEREREVIDIDAVNKKLDDIAVKHLEKHLASQLMVIQVFGADIDYLSFIERCRNLLNQYELEYNFGVQQL